MCLEAVELVELFRAMRRERPGRQDRQTETVDCYLLLLPYCMKLAMNSVRLLSTQAIPDR